MDLESKRAFDRVAWVEKIVWEIDWAQTTHQPLSLWAETTHWPVV